MSKFNLARKFRPATKAWKSFKSHLQSKLHDPKFVKAISSLRQHCRSILPFLHKKFIAITKGRRPQPNRQLYHHRHHFHPSIVSAIYVDELFSLASPSQEASRKNQDMAGSSNGMPSNTFNPRLVTVSQKSEHIRPHDKVGIKFHGGVAKGSIDKEGEAKEEENNKRRDRWNVPLVPMYRGVDDPNNGKIQMQNNGKVGVEFYKEVPKASTKGKVEETMGEENGKKVNKWKIPSLQKFRGIDERAEEFIAKVRQDMKLEREQSILEFEEMLKRSA